MLKPNEELWKKELPKVVEDLLAKERSIDDNLGERDKTRVVTYRAPHNSAVQIYDYKEKKARVIFGPELVMLGPDEHFTVLSLSGERPKRPNVIKSLGLLLGVRISDLYPLSLSFLLSLSVTAFYPSVFVNQIG